jgi:hypothetical protein
VIEISPDVARLLHSILVQQNIAVGADNFNELAVLVSRALTELAPALVEEEAEGAA